MKKSVKAAIVDSELAGICKHCGKQINQVKLIGFSLICPFCGKLQNDETYVKV